MASQQRPISTQTTLEAGSVSNSRRWTSDGSVTVNVPDDQPSEKKEEEDVEASPTIPAPPVDDFPDGGLAAWSVVFGVSKLTVSSSFRFFDEPTTIVQATCAIFATWVAFFD